MNAIYVRVSTEEQAKSGYSLESQILACQKFIAANAYATADIYKDDGYSGEFIERPGLKRLRNDLYGKLINQVFVYDPDRLSRKLSHMLLLADEIRAAGAELHFMTGNYDASSEGKLFFSLRGAIAEFEKDKIRERTVRGKRSKALSGKLIYNDKAYGYDYDPDKCMYIINEAEAEIIKMIFTLYTTQAYGVRSLKAELNANGIINRKGKPFTLSNLNRILANEMYAGTKWAFKRYDKTVGQHQKKTINRDQSEWIPIPVPAIISTETFAKATHFRKSNTIMSSRNTRHDYLLRNIIRCSESGYVMVGQHTQWYTNDYYYYRCSARANDTFCSNTAYIPADELDETVWNVILSTAQEGRELINLHPVTKQADNTKAKLELHLSNLRQKQTAMLKWVTDGTISISAADKELQTLNKEITATQTALSHTIQTATLTPSVRPEEILGAATFDQKRNAMIKMGMTISAKRNKNREIDWSFKLPD